jgi:hypothetical protein
LKAAASGSVSNQLASKRKKSRGGCAEEEIRRNIEAVNDVVAKSAQYQSYRESVAGGVYKLWRSGDTEEGGVKLSQSSGVISGPIKKYAAINRYSGG